MKDGLKIPNHPSMPESYANGYNTIAPCPPPVSPNGMYQANVNAGKARIASVVIGCDVECFAVADKINLYSFSCSRAIDLIPSVVVFEGKDVET